PRTARTGECGSTGECGRMTKRVLGRGLEALIPAVRSASAPTATAVPRAPMPAPPAVGVTVPEPPGTCIVASARQPRHHIDERALAELDASIRAQGSLQPLLVRQVAAHYELIAGERRCLASQRAGLTHVPVVVRDLADEQVLEAALVENLQREDLDPIDEALGYQALIEDLHYTNEKVADRVGKDRTTVANALRLLSVPH